MGEKEPWIGVRFCFLLLWRVGGEYAHMLPRPEVSVMDLVV